MTEPTGRPPRATRRSARTRQRILSAAVEVFARRGLHGTRVADIAESAGIAYGLVYHHFRNKEEILAAIFSEQWTQYVGYLDEVGRMPLPFRERISKLVHFWVQTYRQEPQLMTVMVNEIGRSFEFLESHDINTILAAFEPIQTIVRAGQEAGEARRDLDAELVTYAILGIADMVLTGYVMGTLRRNEREDFIRDEGHLVSLMLDGLAAPRSQSH